MDHPPIDDVLRRLRSRSPGEAWAVFLERYSPLLLDVVRLFERREDDAADCYLFICEQLSRRRFARLLCFRPGGPARFSTWLCAVTRNLCLDWHRKEMGRHRVFASIARLSPLEQQLFQCLFVEPLTLEEAFLKLRSAFPRLTLAEMRDSADRVERALTSRQRWLLGVRRTRTGLAQAVPLDGAEDRMLWPAAREPDPETRFALQEARAALAAALAKLPPRQRLLVRLRFGRELTFEEIARLLRLDSPQHADRQIRQAVEALRKAMSGPARGALPATQTLPER
jgi:RNA polymerase sigma factor (sigma-70 family)